MRSFYFTEKNIGDEKYLTYTMGEGFDVDEDALDICEETKPEELIDVIYSEDDDFDYLSYDISGMTTIDAFISQETKAVQMLNLVRNVANSLISLKDQGLQLSYIVLNRKFSYVEQPGLKVKFICLPVPVKGSVGKEFKGFIRQLLANTRYDVDEDLNYVAKLLTYINSDAFNLRGLVGLTEALMEENGIEFDESSAIDIDGAEVVNAAPDLSASDDNKNIMSGLSNAEEVALPEIGDDEEEEDTPVAEDEDMDIAAAMKAAAEKAAVEETVAAPEEEIKTSERPPKKGFAVKMDTKLDLGLGDMDEEEEDHSEEEAIKAKAKNSKFGLKVGGNFENEEYDEKIANALERADKDRKERVRKEHEKIDDEIQQEYAQYEEHAEVLKAEAEAKAAAKEAEEAGAVNSAEVEASEPEEAAPAVEETESVAIPQIAEPEEEDVPVVTKQEEDAIKDKIKALLGEAQETKPAPGSTIPRKNVVKVNRAAIIQQNTIAAEEAKAEEAEEAEAKAEAEVADEAEDKKKKGFFGFGGGSAAEEEKDETPAPVPAAPAAAPVNTLLNMPKAMPYLVRVATKERIMLNKVTFKIGRGKTGTDYTVSGNGAIGRTHAIIVQRDGKCYVRDNKSVNHTYVNDKMLEGDFELPLAHDNILRLGDEEFIFKSV